MKRILSYSAVIISLGWITSSAFAQTTANGPYYATPSWDQQLPAATRFIVLANWQSAAVLDRETGLVWEKVPRTSTVFSWITASRHCSGLDLGGRKGWRLPTLQELASLVDSSQSNPALPSGHPFTVQSSNYWSASTFADDTADAYSVAFENGIVLVNVKSSPNLLVWCVRGGQGVNPQ
jgi:hypothetical protein